VSARMKLPKGAAIELMAVQTVQHQSSVATLTDACKATAAVVGTPCLLKAVTAEADTWPSWQGATMAESCLGAGCMNMPVNTTTRALVVAMFTSNIRPEGATTCGAAKHAQALS